MHGKNNPARLRASRLASLALSGLVPWALAACSSGEPAPRTGGDTTGAPSAGSTGGTSGNGGSTGSTGNGASGNGGNAGGGTSGGGSGGTTSGGAGGGSGSGSGGGTSGGGSSSGSGGGTTPVDAGGGGSASDAGGGTTAAYPAGPYGFNVGDVIANSSFMGYRNGAGAWTSLQISDYYDPTGSRGIRALYVTLGEVGCGACVQEAPNINTWKTQYEPYGAAFLSALWRGEMQNPDGSWSATQATVDAWVAQFKITYDMVADPTIELANGVAPTDNPNGYLVDTRTMKIVQHYPGAPGSLYGMTALLKQNGATGL